MRNGARITAQRNEIKRYDDLHLCKVHSSPSALHFALTAAIKRLGGVSSKRYMAWARAEHSQSNPLGGHTWHGKAFGLRCCTEA